MIELEFTNEFWNPEQHTSSHVDLMPQDGTTNVRLSVHAFRLYHNMIHNLDSSKTKHEFVFVDRGKYLPSGIKLTPDDALHFMLKYPGVKQKILI